MSPSEIQMDMPTIDDIKNARDVIAGQAIRTPLLQNKALNEILGGRIFVKPEIMQRTGSFKFRGAYNRISGIQTQTPGVPIVACSSGNHAQGVAAASKIHGVHSTIVMPKDAPDVKKQRTEAYGATIKLYDRYNESREEIALEIADRTGAKFVPPYDDKGVIAGQGTVGAEIIEDAEKFEIDLDHVLVPCGGGGLTAGVALAVSELSPGTLIHPVEPENFDDYSLSLKAGDRRANKAQSGTICDAIMTQMPGELTFSINKSRLSQGLVVTDEEVRHAMLFAFKELKLVVEPGGCVALAALLSGKLNVTDKNVAIVLSGGNVDSELFAKIISM